MIARGKWCQLVPGRALWGGKIYISVPLFNLGAVTSRMRFRQIIPGCKRHVNRRGSGIACISFPFFI